MVRRPDFVGVGAPKTGTASLWYLKQHPQISLTGKELHFFGSDLAIPLRPSLENYQARLASITAPSTGDVAGWYLYSHSAADEIRRYAPDVKISALLRDPADPMYALHAKHLVSLEEDEPDFTRALQLESLQRQGERIPRYAQLPWATQYRAIYDHYPKLERYYQVFPREQMLVLTSEEFWRDPVQQWAWLMEFLEIDPHFSPAFGMIKSRTRLRSPALARLTRSGVQQVARRTDMSRAPASLKRLGQGAMGAIRRLNQGPASVDPLDREGEAVTFCTGVVRLAVSNHFSVELARVLALLNEMPG